MADGLSGGRIPPTTGLGVNRHDNLHNSGTEDHKQTAATGTSKRQSHTSLTTNSHIGKRKRKMSVTNSNVTTAAEGTSNKRVTRSSARNANVTDTPFQPALRASSIKGKTKAASRQTASGKSTRSRVSKRPANRRTTSNKESNAHIVHKRPDTYLSDRSSEDHGYHSDEELHEAAFGDMDTEEKSGSGWPGDFGYSDEETKDENHDLFDHDEEDDLFHDTEGIEDHEDNDDDEDDEDEDEHDEDGGEDGEDEDDLVLRHGFRFGTMLGGMMPGIPSQFRYILEHLRNNDNPTQKLVALQELAETLSISTEQSLPTFFTSDILVKELIKILKGSSFSIPSDADEDLLLAIAMSDEAGNQAELMLLACRCITNLLDVQPSAAITLVSQGMLDVLCDKLKLIQYIDLAEQALCALEKLAGQMPHAAVQAGALGAVVLHFDFFSIDSQRTALRTVSHCMRSVGTSSMERILDALPTLTQTLSYTDRTVVELTCLSWRRLAERLVSSRDQFEMAVSVDVLTTMMGLVPVPGNTLAVRPGTFFDLLRIIRAVSKCSPHLGYELLKLDIVGTFYQILTGSSQKPQPQNVNPVPYTVLDTKWNDAIPTILKIIVDLLPPLPSDGIFDQQRFMDEEPVASRTRSASHVEEPSGSGQTEIETVSNSLDAAFDLFDQNKDLQERIGPLLTMLLLEIYQSTVNIRVRQLVTRAMVKLVACLKQETLQRVFGVPSLPMYLASVLTQQEHASLVRDALIQVELLITKVPDVCSPLFEREGVMHEISTIASEPLSLGSGTPSSKPRDILQGLLEDDATDASSESGRSQSHSRTRTTIERRQRLLLDDVDGHVDAHHLLAHRRLLGGLSSLFDLHQGTNESPVPDGDKNLGSGITRATTLRRAQHIIKLHEEHMRQFGSASNDLGTLHTIAEQLKRPDSHDPLSRNALGQFACALKDTKMGVSSFEMVHSGMIAALLAYLTVENSDQAPVTDRRKAFQAIISGVTGPESPLQGLVKRLHDLLTRFERFDVVTPAETSSSRDSSRNPMESLAKQLRIRLTGEGPDVPIEYRRMIVSTHAVATFKVLEDYLLKHIEEAAAGDEDDDQGADVLDGLKDEGSRLSSVESMDLDTIDECLVDESTEHEGDAHDMSSQSRQQDQGTSSSSQGQKKRSTSDTNGHGAKWEIQFFFENERISIHSTIYAIAHRHTDDTNIRFAFVPITYKRVRVDKARDDKPERPEPMRTQLARSELPSELAADNNVCRQVLDLLCVLSKLHTSLTGEPLISPRELVNRKLIAKMDRQLEEPLIVASECLPAWTFYLMREYPFLFPFETRYLFFQSTSFGYARLLSRWQTIYVRNAQNGSRGDSQQHPLAIGRMDRQKVKISRQQMIESTIKILKLFGSAHSILEIEYVGEEGTGLGPTLEFYATVSKEFCKKSIGMWYDNGLNEASMYVDATCGLFPIPMAKVTSRADERRLLDMFKTLGQFLAKAMLDFRIIDIPFNIAFFRCVLRRDTSKMILLKDVDPTLFKSMTDLASYVQKDRGLEGEPAVENTALNGSRVEDLCLDFTMPGRDSIELKPGGSSIPVTMDNVEEYLELLLDAMVGRGIEKQIQAFRDGFNELLSVDDLGLFTEEELASFFGTATEDWSFETLMDAFKADHGFTMNSEPVKYLMEILSEMDEQERREFLQFTTGSPRLPIGGWKALRPVFTVVRKHCEPPFKPDDYLPSVMTCANYLKMPEYSTKDVMRQRLLKSIREGKNSFLLS